MTYLSRVASPVTKLRARAMAPSFGWSIGQRSSGVGHTSAPSIRSRAIFSSGAPDGMVIVHGIPRRLDSAAMAIPVFPDVGSTILFPSIFSRRRKPSRRYLAVRSLIEPKGFIHSSLAKIAPVPAGAMRPSRTRGVGFSRLPISCEMSSNTFRDRSIFLLLLRAADDGRGGGFSDEQDGRGADPGIYGGFGQAGERSPDEPLPAPRAVLHDDEGRVGR